MANWVKFTERMPRDSDVNHEGKVVIQYEDGTLTTAGFLWVLDDSGRLDTPYKDCYWLENVPELPKPRTLEDVAGELVAKIQKSPKLCKEYLPAWWIERVNEMKEILEREDDERS